MPWIVALASSASILAQIVAYEATGQFPDTADPAWERSGTFDCERWIQDGRFFQQVDLGQWAPPPGGEQDKYQRFLSDFVGEAKFFIEWRLRACGDSSEIGGVAPSSVVAGGVPGTGVSYHFTVADDEVRLIRGNFNPILFVDIEPGQSHVHRIELYGTDMYIWYIDGEIIDSGVPDGAFPTSDTNVVSFRAKSWYLDNTVIWDYIRYGTIPPDASGDFDSDGDVDAEDAYFFVDCLLGPGASWPGCAWADMNADGVTDGDDMQAFVDAMLGS